MSYYRCQKMLLILKFCLIIKFFDDFCQLAKKKDFLLFFAPLIFLKKILSRSAKDPFIYRKGILSVFFRNFCWFCENGDYHNILLRHGREQRITLSGFCCDGCDCWFFHTKLKHEMHFLALMSSQWFPRYHLANTNKDLWYTL
jgi:hypothetical protein